MVRGGTVVALAGAGTFLDLRLAMYILRDLLCSVHLVHVRSHVHLSKLRLMSPQCVHEEAVCMKKGHAIHWQCILCLFLAVSVYLSSSDSVGGGMVDKHRSQCTVEKERRLIAN